MKVAIMGTGAMASLFGARMAQQGNEVWLVSGWKENVDTVRATGITVHQKDVEDITVFPHATMQAADVIADGVYPDLVLISCKGMQTAATVQKALPIIGEKTSVLTLQNGLGNAEVIAQYVPADRVYFGNASVASDLVKPGEVKDTTNRNRSPLISLMPFNREMTPRCKEIGDLFQSLGYDTNASLTAEKYVWTKLCVNSCANALAGISLLPNYIYSNDRDGFQIINHVCAEVVAVAKAKGIDADYDDLRSYVHFTLYNQHHYVSMCQDMHNKRPTEIDTINGAIVREGKKLGIPTPVNETLMHLVRLISNHYADQWIKD